MSDRRLSTVIFLLLTVLGVLLMTEGVLAPGNGETALTPAEPGLRVVVGFVFGLGIGAVSSLLGVAGGEIIIPTLVLAFGAPIKIAGSLSLLISLPTVAVGLARYARSGMLNDRMVWVGIIAPMALGAASGATIGGLLVGAVPAGALKVTLGAALIWSAKKTLRKSRRVVASVAQAPSSQRG